MTIRYEDKNNKVNIEGFNFMIDIDEQGLEVRRYDLIRNKFVSPVNDESKTEAKKKAFDEGRLVNKSKTPEKTMTAKEGGILEDGIAITIMKQTKNRNEEIKKIKEAKKKYLDEYKFRFRLLRLQTS